MPRLSSLDRSLEYQTISLSDHSPENLARLKRFWPHEPVKFKRLLRREAAEVVRRGVVVRIGKALILNVPAYLSWLATYSPHAFNYTIAPNREQHKHKRFGGGARRRTEEPVPA